MPDLFLGCYLHHSFVKLQQIEFSLDFISAFYPCINVLLENDGNFNESLKNKKRIVMPFKNNVSDGGGLKHFDRKWVACTDREEKGTVRSAEWRIIGWCNTQKVSA